MRVIAFNQHTRSNKEYVDLFLRIDRATYGGLNIKKNYYFISSPIPDTIFDTAKASILTRLGRYSEARVLMKDSTEPWVKRLKDRADEEDSSHYHIEEIPVSPYEKVMKVQGDSKLEEILIKSHLFKDFADASTQSHEKFRDYGFTEYVLPYYDFTKDVELPKNIVSALKKQKLANIYLDIADTDYFMVFSEAKYFSKRTYLKSLLSREDPDKDAKKLMTLYARQLTKQRKIVETLSMNNKNQIQYAREILGEEVFIEAKDVLYGIKKLFNNDLVWKLRECSGLFDESEENSLKVLFESSMDKVFHFKDYNDFSDRKQIAQKRYDRLVSSAKGKTKTILKKNKNDILSTLEIPDSVLFSLLRAKELQEQINPLIQDFDGRTEITEHQLNIYLENFYLDDLKFLDTREPKTGVKSISIDIESRKYPGSIIDPLGSEEESILINIISEKKNYSVGIFRMDGLKVIDKGVECDVEYATNSFRERRRAAQIIKWILDPETKHTYNGEAYDFPKMRNNFIAVKTAEKEGLKELLKKDYHLVHDEDGAFLCNIDNTGVVYKGRTWSDRYSPISTSADTLFLVTNYIRTLINDRTLTSAGQAFDALGYKRFGIKDGKIILELSEPLGFKKAYETYSALELSAKKAIEEGDKKEGRKLIQYCYVDNRADFALANKLDAVMEFLSMEFGIEKERLYRSAVKDVATSFIDKWLAKKLGMIRSEPQKRFYEMVDVEMTKRRIFKLVFDENLDDITLGKKEDLDENGYKGFLHNTPGRYDSGFLFFNSHITEAARPILTNLGLDNIYNKMTNSTDPIERIIIQKMLDAITCHIFADYKLVIDTRKEMSHFGVSVDENYFNRVYGMDVKEFHDLLKRNIKGLSDEMFSTKPFAITGDLAVYPAGTIEEKLVGLNFTPIAYANLHVVNNINMIYALRPDPDYKEPYIASSGFGIFSYKRRFTSEKKYFEPKLKTEFVYDTVRAYLDFGLETATKFILEIINKIKNDEIPHEKYIIALDPKHELEDYSERYRNTKRYKLMEHLGAKKGHPKFIIVEKDFNIKEIDPTNFEQQVLNAKIDPVFYLCNLFEKGRKIDMLLKSFFMNGLSKKVHEGLLEKLLEGEMTEEEMERLCH